jgi:methionyl-tRNA formyltransferase
MKPLQGPPPNGEPLRILFAASPAIAVPSLLAVAAGSSSWKLVGLLTNPDKARGRSGRPEPTEAAAALEGWAEKAGLPPAAILKPERLGAEARELVSALEPDILVCFAYGRIFGPRFLSLFPLGGINIHPSLLPKYRGASPIQEAILRRDTVTGICIQKLAPEMDTGAIIAQKELVLGGRETSASLGERAGVEAAALLCETLNGIAAAGKVPEGRPQEAPLDTEGDAGSLASYCSRIDKNSGIIDWTMSAEEIDALIRAYTPWPLAQTAHKGQILYILEAAPLSDTGASPPDAGPPGLVLGKDKKYGILIQTGGGILAVTCLQYQTRKALPWQAFLNGAGEFIGSRLISEDC